MSQMFKMLTMPIGEGQLWPFLCSCHFNSCLLQIILGH